MASTTSAPPLHLEKVFELASCSSTSEEINRPPSMGEDGREVTATGRPLSFLSERTRTPGGTPSRFRSGAKDASSCSCSYALRITSVRVRSSSFWSWASLTGSKPGPRMYWAGWYHLETLDMASGGSDSPVGEVSRAR